MRAGQCSRYGRGLWRGCRAGLLFRDELLPGCHPGYLQAQGATETDPLGRATLLQHNLRPSDWPDWLRASELPAPVQARSRHFEDLGIVYESARASMGIAMGQWAYVQADIVACTLVVPFRQTLQRPLGYHLVSQQDRANLRKIRASRDWIMGAPELANP